jgi:hypothetical protein
MRPLLASLCKVVRHLPSELSEPFRVLIANPRKHLIHRSPRLLCSQFICSNVSLSGSDILMAEPNPSLPKPVLVSNHRPKGLVGFAKPDVRFDTGPLATC